MFSLNSGVISWLIDFTLRRVYLDINILILKPFFLTKETKSFTQEDIECLKSGILFDWLIVFTRRHIYVKIFWFNKLSFKPRKQRNQEFDVERYRRKLIGFFIAFKSNDTYHYSCWGNLYNLIFKNIIWFAGRKLIHGCHVKSSTTYASSVGKSLKSPAR